LEALIALINIRQAKSVMLNQIEMGLLRNELETFASIDSRSWLAITNTLTNTASLNETLNVILVDQAATLDSTVLRKAQLIVAIYDISNQNLSLALDVSRKTNTLAEVAQKHYVLLEDAPPFARPGDAAIWKRKLFTLQPTAVLLGLISTSKIASIDEQTKDLVVEALCEAVQRGYKISEDSPREIVRAVQEMSDATEGTKKAATKFIYQLQNLQGLVREPEEIDFLMRRDFDTSRRIVAETRQDFVERMTVEGMSAESATHIYDHARIHEARNEQKWLTAMQERSGNMTPKGFP
jgi:hypothetical protein